MKSTDVILTKQSTMNLTVFLTVLSGVLTYVVGQLVVKLVIEPVQDLKRTIGHISHALIERAHIIQNPGVSAADTMRETSHELRKLSSHLRSHLYLVPGYAFTAWVFRLPSRERISKASSSLIGLSNALFEAKEINRKSISKNDQTVRESLGTLLTDNDTIADQ